MSLETEVLLKISASCIVAGLIFVVLMKRQRSKELEADAKFDFEMNMIEMRNKQYGGSNESKKST